MFTKEPALVPAFLLIPQAIIHPIYNKILR